MRDSVSFYKMGCACLKMQNGEYCFHIIDYTCREVIKVPPEIYGVPVTRLYFGCDYDAYRSSNKSILKKVYITERIRSISREFDCYAFMIPEIVIDEKNKQFRFRDGVLYEGDKLLFATDICGRLCRVLPGTREICDSAFLGSNVKKVILPPSVLKVETNALRSCTAAEVFDNVSAEILYSNGVGIEFIVYSHESGELIYKLYYPGVQYEDQSVTQNRNMCNLNFGSYDDLFESSDIKLFFDETLLICLDRLMYPYRLSKAAEERYKGYISDNRTEAVKNVIGWENFEQLKFLLELGAVVPENLEELTEYCVCRNKTEFTALLLDHKGRNFPGELDSISLK